MTTIAASSTSKLRVLASLCKVRVNSLIVFTAMIGMMLAQPGLPPPVRFLAASAGIGLVAFAAAAINCLIERTVDARMMRTQGRPLPRGEIAPAEALGFAILLGALGLALLHAWVNDLTLWLTLATFLGYAVVYTVLLKPATPMNIVIGGAAGAMPPLLGWTAMTGAVTPQAMALFLIIFLWTPPHFWSLCMARRDDYAKAGFPMLPVTHGIRHTCLQSLIYVALLCAASTLPVVLGMAGPAYALPAIALDAIFLRHAYGLWRQYNDHASLRMFRYSINYLCLIFASLFLDRLLSPWLTV
ncbi:MAG TPA: heme o synthase [Rhodocyclaceae bacterium]|nr:heme o synthase [Rhodocyclaceae bacterium]